MPQINYLISQHKLAAIIEKQARCYMPKKYELDAWRVGQLQLAMNWIRQAVIDSKACGETCNESFQALPGGRTFADVWSDPNVWISFQLDPDPKLYGQAVQWGRDIAVGYGSFRKGWKTVAATLIHELAHINGAGDRTKDAEKTLLACGLADRYRKEIIGYLRAIPSGAIAIA